MGWGGEGRRKGEADIKKIKEKRREERETSVDEKGTENRRNKVQNEATLR